jgi:hypothetical protein
MGASELQAIPIKVENAKEREIRDALQRSRSKELVFAVVGYAGSGTSFVAGQTRMMLDRELRSSGGLVQVLKARSLLDEFATVKGMSVAPGISRLETTRRYQEIGDSMRLATEEHGAVAAYAVRRIQKIRSADSSARNIFVVQ